MKNKSQHFRVGFKAVALLALACSIPLFSQAARTEKDSSAVDAEEYADMMAHEAYDLEDLAEGAEIQRRMFNRMTPPGFSWLQPMFPSVVPFDADNFTESFLEGLLGEDENSVAVYPLSLVLDPKTRETLVYNAEGKLIAVVPAEEISHVWPEDADPARVTLLLDLLPSEDIEPFLYVKERISESLAAFASKFKVPKPESLVMKSLGSSDFGICDIQKLTNGNMRLTVTNGETVAEVFSYTVLHSASNVVSSNGTNTVWTPLSPPFNGLESAWECRTNNLLLTNGVGIWEDSSISSNARVRFYGVAKWSDSDEDGLTDGMESFVHHTDPDNPDTDGDGWSDGEEIEEETDPLDRFSATKLARGVVLNEVLYNPSGADDEKEWVELYSASRYPVDLSGFVIQVASNAFGNAFVFPTNSWIQPGRCLLLGGSAVTNRDYAVSFTMPNCFTNEPTGAVRLAAEQPTNTLVADILMYGGNPSVFNSNGLDTTGWLSTSAPWASAASSVVRWFAGVDSDQRQDWTWASVPTPTPSSVLIDSDGDNLTDQVELTGSSNVFNEATNPHNADSDGDGLNDYSECITHGTDPNTWATDGDLFPWSPTTNAAVSNWWGSDSYELANGWNPLVYDENTNNIPDSWEMAFPGTNLYADADGDGISNYDELTQNSDPFDNSSTNAQPYVLHFESSIPGWQNDGMTDVGLKGWVKIYFEGLKTNTYLCVWVKECRTQEEFRVEWFDASLIGTTWLNNNREVVTSASALAGSRPYLLVQDLGMHPDFTTTLGGEYTNAVIQVDFLDAAHNVVPVLNVAKWTNSFNAGPLVKDNFIDLDTDHFYLRVNDPSKTGSGTISIHLSTDSDGTSYDDVATEIELDEEPANPGVFISTNLLMVSDDVDDDFTNPYVVADDTKNDRTHKVALGGKVKALYSCTAAVDCEKEAVVPPSLKTVEVSVVVLRDKPAVSNGVPVVTTTHVSNMWNIVRERYAQVGVTIVYNVTIEDPPSGVDLTDGLLVRDFSTNRVLATEAKELIASCGTVGTNNDIHVFYVNTVMVGPNQAYGSAVADYYYYPSENDYLYNAFIDNSVNKPFNAAHELAHLLADAPHVSEEFNVLYSSTSTANFPAATKRLDTTQETNIRGNAHAQ